MLESEINMSNIFADNILKGKVAFLTGRGTGITGGVARAFVRHGAKIAITSRKEENLIRAKAVHRRERRRVFRGCRRCPDFDAVQNAIAKTVEHYGKIDIVVNGAAEISSVPRMNCRRTVSGPLLI